MNRDEAKALAEEIGRRYGKRVAGLGPPLETFDVTLALLCEEAVAEALDRALTPTRIEAAERECVEAALAWADSFMSEDPRNERMMTAVAKRELEAARRLRALREQRAAEECGAKPSMFVSVRQVFSDSEVLQREKDVRCHLQRGHEGEHEGELGCWRWA